MMDAGTFLGVDIGKSGHYALAVDGAGKVIYQTPVANDEAALRKLVAWAHEHLAVLVVDQPGGAAACCCDCAGSPTCGSGTCMGWRWRAHASSTQVRARPIPRIPSFSPTWHVLIPAALSGLSRRVTRWRTWSCCAGYDADLRGDANRLSNRLRALLGTHWPALERALGERLDTRGVLAVLQQYPSGLALKEAGVEQITAALKAERIRRPDTFAKQLYEAAMAQTVTITGAQTAAQLVMELAGQLATVLARRDTLEKEIEQGFFALPEAAILRSPPGIGPRLGARIAVEIGSIDRFRTPAHLAAYAGLGPTPWKSGTSINANVPSRFGNHRLKNALFLAAFASLRHAPSRIYYDRKRSQGKRHNQAVLCLARRRVDVLHAMLTHGAPYRTPAPQAAAA